MCRLATDVMRILGKTKECPVDIGYRSKIAIAYGFSIIISRPTWQNGHFSSVVKFSISIKIGPATEQALKNSETSGLVGRSAVLVALGLYSLGVL